MKRQVEYKCPQHPDPFDCGDNVLIYSKSHKEFGIIVHDGGSSFITIKYCPFCGKKL
jgi:hypothetical protein